MRKTMGHWAASALFVPLPRTVCTSGFGPQPLRLRTQLPCLVSAPSFDPNVCRGPRCCVPGASDVSTHLGKHGPLAVSSDGAVYLPVFGQSTVLSADACLPPDPFSNQLPAVNSAASSWN